MLPFLGKDDVFIIHLQPFISASQMTADQLQFQSNSFSFVNPVQKFLQQINCVTRKLRS